MRKICQQKAHVAALINRFRNKQPILLSHHVVPVNWCRINGLWMANELKRPEDRHAKPLSNLQFKYYITHSNPCAKQNRKQFPREQAPLPASCHSPQHEEKGHEHTHQMPLQHHSNRYFSTTQPIRLIQGKRCLENLFRKQPIVKTVRRRAQVAKNSDFGDLS